ncbi:MAG: phosphate acyltransferase PlsX, partial [Eubacteriales bacterium]|nr:phosphate acyltransferase PlsX [Eubacteriales bacterium]
LRIAVDAMGGDNAPLAIINGCIDALKEISDVEIELFGPIEVLKAHTAGLDADLAKRLILTDAPDTISMHDAPVEAVRRKKDSSIVMALRAVKEKRCDAFISAGSTGAVLAGGLFVVGRIRGVKRPALASLLPSEKGFCLLMDCGSNMDCRPFNLVQFGVMGSVYMKKALQIAEPRVGLLNVGVEDEKGNELCKETFPRMKEQRFRFVGNIEARDVAAGAADVVVTDGFAGNILMKGAEGYGKFFMKSLKEALYGSFWAKIGGLLAKKSLYGIKKKMDYKEYGGAPLLGVDGIVIKTHGSSDAYSVLCTVRQAVNMIRSGFIPEIKTEIESMDAFE